MGKRIAALALASAVVFGSSIPAYAASCWSAEEVAAAKVRDLQTRLMVAGLKCRSHSPGMLAAYNRFVVAHRANIQRENDILRARFIRLSGRSAGERAYDSFTTALANSYGSTRADREACADMEQLARDAASTGVSDLSLLAEANGLRPDMDGGRCPMRVASRR